MGTWGSMESMDGEWTREDPDECYGTQIMGCMGVIWLGEAPLGGVTSDWFGIYTGATAVW